MNPILRFHLIRARFSTKQVRYFRHVAWAVVFMVLATPILGSEPTGTTEGTKVTTVLIIRHGEKQNPNGSGPREPLSDLGKERARRLCATLSDAGIKAVYSTKRDGEVVVRTHDTVKPLADELNLPVQFYLWGGIPKPLADMVLADHHGEVVLVAAHSDSMAQVANAFGAELPKKAIDDFDNLYVVSVSHEATEVTNVVNLQYGADSPDKLPKNDPQAMTLLLVGASGSGDPKPKELLHTATKAGVTAIFANDEYKSLVALLATKVTSANFDATNLKAFAKQLISNHRERTVVVAAKKAELEELIRELGGSPFRAIDDRDDLIVLTLFESGAVRVMPMRF